MNELIKFDVTIDSEIKSFSCPLLEYKDKPVLISTQLAYILDIEHKTIRNNFNNNIDEFEEDEDFFRLEGEELAEFKKYIKNITFPNDAQGIDVDSLNKINKLYLWTEEGVSNHAKISNSKNAWKIFKVIKKVYFKTRDSNQISVLRNQLSDVMTNLNTMASSIITLTSSVNDLTVIVTNQKPKVDAYELFLTTHNYLDIEAVAKSISDKYGKGKIIGKNNLLKYLRAKGVLTKTNLPMQKYIDNRMFGVYVKTYDYGRKYSQAVVSSDGMIAIINSLKKDKFI